MDRAEWERRVAAEWSRADCSADERVKSMRELAQVAPHAALGAFELAGSYDAADREREAADEYERAVRSGLSDVDSDRMAQLIIQHSSTLRNLGRVDEAIAMLQDAASHPSVGAAREIFLALALRDAGCGDEALRVVIDALAPTLPRYQASVRAYAAALTA